MCVWVWVCVCVCVCQEVYVVLYVRYNFCEITMYFVYFQICAQPNM